MVGLREIPRTATFTWSPGTASTLIATGTRAGAVDADFSNNTQLELWDLDLSNTKKGIELQPSASIDTDSRFHDIAWVQPTDGHSRGIIAGALENGSLDLWDAEKLLNGDGDLFVSRTTTHSGAIKTLQFNPFRSELLATAGAQGEIFISDINNIANPFRLGTGRTSTAARADDFECLDWNKKVPHIMVTGSSRGSVTVWDVKTKKESLTLKDLGRKPVAAVAWDPEKPTRLITAVPLDADSLIQVWDLRNSSAPERVLKGHEGDVLSLSWCRQDSDLLLSCGKDNRTICWNPQTGDAYGEFPTVENWTFQTKWNPHSPSIFATASFDGKIAVQTIQNTNSGNDHDNGMQSQALDGEEFFNKAQAQLPSASFSLPKAPKWLERPCGASFGFGGKVLSFTLGESNGTLSRYSIVRLSNFVVDTEIGAMTDAFEKAMSEHDLKSICENRIAQTTLEAEKADWKIIETLISDNPRKELVNYLGFSKNDDEPVDKPSKLDTNGDAGERLSTHDAGGARNNRLSAFFDNSHEGDNFLSDLAATKGAKTNNPFHIYSGSESDSDRTITHALMLGQFAKAMEVCLREDRMSDAFMIAICGGQQCIDQVQKAYFTKQADGPKYLRLLASVVGKNLWDVVYNADLENWREVMATLCTYANAEEFPDLCEALGDRLEERLSHASKKSESRTDATFCYLAGSKLEKVVDLWIAQLEHNESSELQDESQNSSFSNHARSLQSLIEKVTVFREVTRYQDGDRNAFSDWKLASLYDKYIEYADIAASHGQLQIAEKYLDLLPNHYSAAEVARNRIKQATRKPATVAAARQPVNTPVNTTMNAAAASNRTMKSMPTFEDQRQPAKSSVPSTSMYTPLGLSQPEGAYAPQGHGSYGAQSYQHTQQAQQQQFGMAPPLTYGAPYSTNNSLGPPPRTFNASPSIAPPSKDKNMSNWNDTPEDFFKPPTSRRSTPNVVAPPMNAPFTNQPTMPTLPMAGQSFGAQSRSTPPAPPPKGPAPPPRSMTPQTMGSYSHQQPERPPSSAANIYAPQQSSNHLGPGQQQPSVPRGPSPYNAPPSGPPPPNRYTPAPAAQAPAPVAKRPAPPPNPYASQQNLPTRQSFPAEQYGPQATPLQQPAPPPTASTTPAGHSEGSRPGTAQSQKGRASVPATPKYPSGDRSHIPANARPIYEILSEDMHRVKSRAPAAFKAHVNDMEKRLNFLFDHLNNEDLLKPNTVEDMVELAQAIRAKNYDQAQAIHIDILTNRNSECGTWMTGVKRLISMSKATP